MEKEKQSVKWGNNKQKNLPFHQQMGTVIMFMFAIVLIVSVFILGYQAYQTSTDALKKNYESMTAEILKSVEEIVEEHLSQFELVVNYLSKDPNVRNLDTNPDSEDWLLEKLKGMLEAQNAIFNVYYAPKQGGFYIQPLENHPGADFKAQERPWYKAALSAEGEPIWTAPYVDTGTGNVVVTVAKAVYDNNRFKGVVAVDVTTKNLGAMVNEINIGGSGFPILVDENLKTITHRNDEYLGKPIPVPALEKAMENNERGTIHYNLESNGNFVKKMAIYGKIESSGWRSMAVIEEREIDEKAHAVLYKIAFIGLVTLLVALIAVWFFSKRISKNVAVMVRAMNSARGGDLTTKVPVKSKDELKLLGNYMEETFSELGELIGQIQDVSVGMSGSAENLAATAEQTSASANEVARTVDDIAKGAQDQAEDAEKAAMVARQLSERFQELFENTEAVNHSAKEAAQANTHGMKAILGLKEKSNESSQANDEIGHVIEALNEKTNHIGAILDTISSISEQTNLLALNASIEAARAGEHGRGFAVVAEEIRKLAEESAGATDKIRDIVTNIQSDSEETVNSMGRVRKISEEHFEAVEDVNNSFDNISKAIEGISRQIEIMIEHVERVDREKEMIVSSIENISAVSEETAAASQQVTATVDQQTVAVEEVAKAAERLNEMAQEVNKNTARFKI